MATFTVKGFGELNKLFREHSKARSRRIKQAVRKTAQRGKSIVAKNVPVAFGELRAALHNDGHRVFADAPHAAAIENGSRPHWVPLEPLIAWVNLRGTQGLLSDKQLARRVGKTTAGHARTVAAQIRDRMSTDGSDSIAADALEQIAREIQAAIAKRGTKPHHYMAESVPAVTDALDEEIRKALPDP